MIAFLCGVLAYGVFSFVCIKLGGSLHETSNLSSKIDLAGKETWINIVIALDALILIGASIFASWSGLKETPFCESCNEWYQDSIKAVFPFENAALLLSTLETHDPRYVNSFMPAIAGSKEPRMEISLRKCTCDEADYFLSTNVKWQVSKKNPKGKESQEGKEEKWFSTMISSDLGRMINDALIDTHLEETPIPPNLTPIIPKLHVSPYTPTIKPEKPMRKKPVWVTIFVILSLLIVISLLVFTYKPFGLFIPKATQTPHPTVTATQTPTHTLTPTPLPTFTPTPLPVEVNFNTLADYPDGQLVIFSGRLALFNSTTCDYQCGLLLENPGNTSQKITIFVTVGQNPNQMNALPENFTKSDIQVRLDDGTYAGIGYRILVTGRKCTTTNDTPCISEIRKIEFNKIP